MVDFNSSKHPGDKIKRFYFGNDAVEEKEKTEKVQEVFSDVAPYYDLMNDLMSLGLHYSWKRHAVSYARLFDGDKVLDLAAGTCDLTYYLSKKYNHKVEIFAAEPNLSMLKKGRDSLYDNGIYKNINFLRCYAEDLPFSDNYFNLVICSFGFRNFTDKQKAIKSISRVLKPGGQFILLEFSKPESDIVKELYKIHAKYAIPSMAKILSGSSLAYQYLVESIEKHPCQKMVCNMLEKEGFENVQVTNILSGIVAIHRGIIC